MKCFRCLLHKLLRSHIIAHLRQACGHESSAEASASFANMGQDIDNLRSRVSTKQNVKDKLAKIQATNQEIESVTSGPLGTEDEAMSDDEGEGMFDGMLKSFEQKEQRQAKPLLTNPRKRRSVSEAAFPSSTIKRGKSADAEKETNPGFDLLGQLLPPGEKNEKEGAPPKQRSGGEPKREAKRPKTQPSGPPASAVKAFKTWQEKKESFCDDILWDGKIKTRAITGLSKTMEDAVSKVIAHDEYKDHVQEMLDFPDLVSEKFTYHLQRLEESSQRLCQAGFGW